MAEAHRIENHRSLKVPDFLKEPLEAAQERLGKLELEAQRVWNDLMVRGRAGRKDIEQILARLSKQDWSLPEMRAALERFREQGLLRAAEWRGKAESWRAEAMERMVVLQGKAVAFLGVATREQVEELSRELERLARKIERGQKPPKKGAKRSGKPSAQN